MSYFDVMNKKLKIHLHSTFQECESLLYHLSQIKAFFLANKYVVVEEMKDADIIFLAGCIAGQETEDCFFTVYNYIRKIYPEKKLIPTGCVVTYKNLDGIGPKSLKLLDRWFDHEISFNEIGIDVLDSKLSSGSIVFHRPKDYYVPISQGCANNCSFCATKKAKGSVSSNSENEILQKIIRLKKNRSASRFVLLSDDCGSYGLDKQTNIAELLNRLLVFKNTFFSLNFFEPSKLETYFSRIKTDFWEKVFYINIPIQSTSNRIVKLMNRKYLVSDIFEIVQEIKKNNPHITIATCLIFGVSSETEQEFNSLLNCYYPFDRIIFFPFSPRPGTPMGEMKQISSSEKRKRVDMIRELSRNDNRVGLLEPNLRINFYA